MDVFHVVYKVIYAPSLVLHLNGEKVGEHDSTVKTPYELNPVVQPRYVDLTSR